MKGIILIAEFLKDLRNRVDDTRQCEWGLIHGDEAHLPVREMQAGVRFTWILGRMIAGNKVVTAMAVRHGVTHSYDIEFVSNDEYVIVGEIEDAPKKEQSNHLDYGDWLGE